MVRIELKGIDWRLRFWTATVCLLGLFVIMGPAHAEYRIWESVTGRGVEAEYDSSTATAVFLLRRDGKRIEVPLNKLSEDDQLYVADRKTESQLVGKKVAIYAPNQGPDTIDLLHKSISKADLDEDEVAPVGRIEQARQTDVLVLYLPHRLESPPDANTLELLRKKKDHWHWT